MTLAHVYLKKDIVFKDLKAYPLSHQVLN